MRIRSGSVSVSQSPAQQQCSSIGRLRACKKQQAGRPASEIESQRQGPATNGVSRAHPTETHFAVESPSAPALLSATCLSRSFGPKGLSCLHRDSVRDHLTGKSSQPECDSRATLTATVLHAHLQRVYHYDIAFCVQRVRSQQTGSDRVALASFAASGPRNAWRHYPLAASAQRGSVAFTAQPVCHVLLLRAVSARASGQ